MTGRLKVGIDFGTTHSGVAWAYTLKPEEVSTIRQWPGSSHMFEKVPSEISYTNTGEVHKWGFEISPSEPRLTWLKQLLITAQYTDTPAIVKTRSLIPSSKKPVGVVADYLSCLKNHTIYTLETILGKELLNATPIDYCLVVPLIWSDSSKALFLQAAESAGLGNKSAIQLISEPEAATLWILSMDVVPNSCKVNDILVVADCGRRTVDLIPYEIVEIVPNFRVRECDIIGFGCLCGSTFLNQNFEELVKSRIGEMMKARARTCVMNEFDEVVGQYFSGSEDEDIFAFPVPGVRDNYDAGIEDGALMLTSQDMKSIFDPVVNEIVQLVRGQIEEVETKPKQHISAVLLIGSFGANKYLFRQLQTRVKRNPPIEILQSTNVGTAVPRGAVLRGLRGPYALVRKSRQHYGIKWSREFNFRVDPFDNLRFCPLTGKPLCAYLVKFYVKLGDEILENAPIAFHCVRNAGLNDNMVFREEIFMCEEATTPLYSNSSTVKTLCTLNADLSSVPKHLFIKKERMGPSHYYEVRFDIVMTLQSALLSFHLEFQGKNYGSVTARYD